MAVAPGGYLDRKYRRALEPVKLNLVCAVLAAVPIFAPHTALPPRAPVPLRADIARVSLSTTTLVGQDRIYGDPGQAPTISLPNPRGAPPGPIANRTWTINHTPLIGQDSIYGDPGQAPTISLPNPLRRIPSATLYEQGPNLQPLLDPPKGETSADLPPAGPRRNPQFEQGPNLQPILTPAAESPPGRASTDLPAVPRRTPQHEQGPNLQIILTPAVDAPSGDQLFDLPPQGAVQPRADIARTSLSTTTLVGQDRIYGDPGQAPTISLPNPPLGPRRAPQYEQGPNLQPILDPPKGKSSSDLPVRSLLARQYEQGPNLQPLLDPPKGEQLDSLPPASPRRNPQFEQGPNLQPLILSVPLPAGKVSVELPVVRPPRLLQHEQGPNLQPLIAPPAGQAFVALPPAGPRRNPQYEQGPNLQLVLAPIQPLPAGKVSVELPPGLMLRPPAWLLSVYAQTQTWRLGNPVICLQVETAALLFPEILTNPTPAPLSLKTQTATLLHPTVLTMPLSQPAEAPLRIEVQTATLLQGALHTEPECECA